MQYSHLVCFVIESRLDEDHPALGKPDLPAPDTSLFVETLGKFVNRHT